MFVPLNEVYCCILTHTDLTIKVPELRSRIYTHLKSLKPMQKYLDLREKLKILIRQTFLIGNFCPGFLVHFPFGA